MKFATLTLLLVALFISSQSPLSAQELGQPLGKQVTDVNPADVIRWQALPASSYPDGRIVVGVRLQTSQGFAIYKKRLTFQGPAGSMARVLTEPAAVLREDPMGEGPVEVYQAGDFEVEFKVDKPWLEQSLNFSATAVGCTETICLFPYTLELTSAIFPADPSASDVSSPVAAAPETQASDSRGIQERYADQLKTGALPLWLVLLVSFLGGVATNLTPCVFPMIPITLRLLARQGQSALGGTLFYALGIVITYSSLGIVASLSGGFFGALLAHPAVNIGFGLIFLVLALTMLGFGNFTKLQNLGAQLGTGKASHLNALAMGAGAGLVAAPCTGPIMGALLAYAAQQKSSMEALALFVVYSLGFALPYVGLGMVAHRATAFKLSPKVQVAVKIIFAAAMVALAAYYLKTPAYQALESLRGQWKWLSLGLLGLGFLMLVTILRSAHLMLKKSTQLLPSLVLGLGLFASIQWATGADLKAEVSWFKTEAEAFEAAKASGKPILIDGWAEWCVACKQMDQETFQDPEVIAELNARWVLLKLDLTELNDTNDQLAEKYEMQGLPTLLLLPSSGDRTTATKLVGFTSARRLMEELRKFEGN